MKFLFFAKIQRKLLSLHFLFLKIINIQNSKLLNEKIPPIFGSINYPIFNFFKKH